MKLEEGMYVRTEEGEISKIKWITVQRWEGLDNTIEASFMLKNKENIEYPRDNFKASYNLIDLIEVGDYVNGLPVVLNSTERGGNIVLVFGGNCFTEDGINDVVTKEQFESMKYEVE